MPVFEIGLLDLMRGPERFAKFELAWFCPACPGTKTKKNVRMAIISWYICMLSLELRKLLIVFTIHNLPFIRLWMDSSMLFWYFTVGNNRTCTLIYFFRIIFMYYPVRFSACTIITERRGDRHEYFVLQTCKVQSFYFEQKVRVRWHVHTQHTHTYW